MCLFATNLSDHVVLLFSEFFFLMDCLMVPSFDIVLIVMSA